MQKVKASPMSEEFPWEYTIVGRFSLSFYDLLIHTTGMLVPLLSRISAFILKPSRIIGSPKMHNYFPVITYPDETYIVFLSSYSSLIRKKCTCLCPFENKFSKDILLQPQSIEELHTQRSSFSFDSALRGTFSELIPSSEFLEIYALAIHPVTKL